MPDREKLLRGLRCLAEREEGTCDDCICKDSKNYSQCIYEIAGYALEMLEKDEKEGASKDKAF